MGIILILNELNLNNSEGTHLNNDGKIYVSTMIELYGYDVKSLQVYLQNLNEIFAAAANTAYQVYLLSPVIMQLGGALFCFNHCVITLHMIPDVMSADDIYYFQKTMTI